jgi:O-acetyl-ADP-ribose deacetylase (regulator of RNase III)
MDEKPKRCFVIMPFGEKTDADGKTIDFDEIYKNIHIAITGDPMRKINGPQLTCIRCDEIARAGWVHRLMISQIYEAEVAIVDISTLNPNVFYELGVRHALRRTVTVLLSRRGTKTPFNIAGFNHIPYDPDDEESLRLVQTQIAQFVANGLQTGQGDSLVYEVLESQGWAGPPPIPLAWEPGRIFRPRNLSGVRIGILTGGLRYIRDIDIWVNSENTNMQMARFYERSGSAVIRYYGARKDATGDVEQDTIAEELAARMNHKPSVSPGTIVVTSPGELKTRGVKWIFHAAAVQGQLGKGYRPVTDLTECVRNALGTADLPKYRRSKCNSILFPLFGTGTGGARVNETVKELIDAAVGYLENNRTSVIKDVYFLALTDHQLNACLGALKHAEAKREQVSQIGAVQE